MGERSYIVVKDSDSKVYLYAHWMTKKDCYDLLKESLKRGKNRWTDGPYLTRIIFCDMIRDDLDGLNGFGISSTRDDGVIRYTVDVNEQKVGKISFDNFIEE